MQSYEHILDRSIYLQERGFIPWVQEYSYCTVPGMYVLLNCTCVRLSYCCCIMINWAGGVNASKSTLVSYLLYVQLWWILLLLHCTAAVGPHANGRVIYSYLVWFTSAWTTSTSGNARSTSQALCSFLHACITAVFIEVNTRADTLKL